MISTRDPRWKNASEAPSSPVAAARGGEVIPSVQWKHKATGAAASLFGAVPWSGAPGDTKEDWEKVTVGWTIRHPDGTIGLGQKPFHTKEEAEKWVEAHPKFPGMNVYANDRWKTAAVPALTWGMMADSANMIGRELLKLAKEAEAERNAATGESKEEIQKIFVALKKAQLEVDDAVILANTLATKFRKAK